MCDWNSKNSSVWKARKPKIISVRIQHFYPFEKNFKFPIQLFKNMLKFIALALFIAYYHKMAHIPGLLVIENSSQSHHVILGRFQICKEIRVLLFKITKLSAIPRLNEIILEWILIVYKLSTIVFIMFFLYVI